MATSSGITTDKVNETLEGLCVAFNKATLEGDVVQLDIKPENPGLSDREEFEVSVTLSCEIDSSCPFQSMEEVIPGDNVVELVESHCTALIAVPQGDSEKIDIVNTVSHSVAPLHLNILTTENAGKEANIDVPCKANCASNKTKKLIDTRTVNCASPVECLDPNSSISASSDEEGDKSQSSTISFDKTVTNVANQIVTPQPALCLTNTLLFDASVMIKDCKSAKELEIANVETVSCATDLECQEKTISSIRSGKDSVLEKGCKSSMASNSGCIVKQTVGQSAPKKIKKKKKSKIAKQSMHSSSVNFSEHLLNQTVADYGISKFSIQEFTEIFQWSIGSVEPRNQTPASGHTQPSSTGIFNSIINNDELDSESQYESALPEEYCKNLPFVYNNSTIGEHSGTMLPASQKIPMSAVPLFPKASKFVNKKKNKKKTKQKSGEVSKKDPLNDTRFSLYGSQLENFPDGLIYTEVENCNVDCMQSNCNIAKLEREVNDPHSRSRLSLGTARPFSLSMPETSYSCISGSTITSQVFTNSKKEGKRNHNQGKNVKSSNKMCDGINSEQLLIKKGKRNKVNNFLKSTTKKDGHNSSSPASPSQKKEAKSSDKKCKKNFEDFWPLEKVLLGIQNGTVLESVIRINPRNYTEAYVTSPAGGQDILIDGVLDRNRAMEGDVVAVLVKPSSEWRLERRQRKPTKSNDTDKIVDKINLEPQEASDNHMVDVVDNFNNEVYLNKIVPQGINENDASKCEILMIKETCSKINDDKTIHENEVSNYEISRDEETHTEINNQTTNENDETNCEISGNKKAPQVTGKVVAILSEQHSRKCVGYLKPMKNKNENFALFSPRDNRIPRLHIPREKCPPDFWVDPASKEDVIYLAKIKKWVHRMFAVGEIVKQVGEVADPQAETTALLMDNDLDVSPYPESLSTMFPTLPSIITKEMMMNRADLRKECIFTIDPMTAKDLDDAVSCKELENGNLEIGVHIADVSYFLSEGTPLDIAVSKRATSVYLVDKVHHMLPVEMCLQCSLLPGQDKLAYSVLWEVTKDAKVISQRITRSIINSCVKLTYEHAQVIIENPDKELSSENFPPILNGFSVSDISKVVNNLQNIAVQHRDQRFNGGALRIDQTKVQVLLDPTGKPIAVEEYINKECHRLIEEFMLLANMTTAKFIYDKYPDLAFLRSHPEPHKHQLEALQELMAARGMHLSVTSAGALQTSLTRYAGDDFLSKSRLTVLNILCAKTMARAKYFCTGDCGEDEFWHYALSVPFYTHFTSPIRRYADIMVHRLLNAALGYCSKPSWTKNYVSSVAEICNKKKYSAKVAGEQSIKLYLSLYVQHHQSLIENAVVIDVKDHSFDVSVCRFGLSMRVYVTKMNVELDYDSNEKVSAMKIKWDPTENYPDIAVQVVELFTVVCIKITCGGKSLKLESELLHPQSSPLIADKSVLTTEEIK